MVDAPPPGHRAYGRVVDEFIARATEMAGRPGRSILGIAGAPGAGKSTFAEAIVAALGPETAILVPMDGFHLAERTLVQLGLRSRKGAPETFDAAGYAHLLRRLAQQTTGIVYAPYFDRALEEPIAAGIAVSADVTLVVTEGNYLLLDSGHWPDARAAMDEVWYLDIDDDVRRERLVERHSLFGKTDLEARAWAHGSDEHNASLVASTAHRADLAITAPAEPSLHRIHLDLHKPPRHGKRGDLEGEP